MFEPILIVVRSLAAYVAAYPFETLVFIFLWWTISALASALPTPKPEGPGWYQLVFNFTHAFSGSLLRIELIRDMLGKFLKSGA